MTRAVTWIVLITALGAAAGLFLLKNQVQSLETALRVERNAIRAEIRAIKVLQAEWSYLNSPERLARLSGRFLGLAPLTAAQTLPIEAVPIRPAGHGEGNAPTDPGMPVPKIKPTLATAQGRQ